jgi:hypothetical protein
MTNGNVVYGSTINTHASNIIFLRIQNNRNNTRTKALTYVPIVQQGFGSSGLVLYVARSGNDAPRIKSNWCSIPLKGGSPRGISAEKISLNSYKRLVIVRGKGVVISSSENNICLHTKVWKDTSTLVETTRSDFVASIARLFNLIALELEYGALCSCFTGEACWISDSRLAVLAIALSHYKISFGVNGSKVIFFPLCTRVYLLLRP